MVDQPPITATRRNKRVVSAMGILGLIVVAALVGCWAYLKSSRQDTTGLDGTWRFQNNLKHSFEILREGELACWARAKEWWNRIGWCATWRRTETESPRRMGIGISRGNWRQGPSGERC